EFELSLDESEIEGEAAAEEGVDSSSEFELTLDEEDMAEAPASAPAVGEVSDSEFELTLDEEGSLAPAADSEEEADKDIFEETDLDVRAGEEEWASGAVALTDVETEEDSSSEFALDLDEQGGVAVEEDDQPVVSLDEEEDADAAAATVARPIPPAGK